MRCATVLRESFEGLALIIVAGVEFDEVVDDNGFL